MKDFLSRISPYNLSGKIKIIAHGIDVSYFRPINNNVIDKIREKLALKNEDIIFIFVGHIDPTKGIEYLLKSMQYIERSIYHRQENFKLLIVGEAYGVYREYLRHLKNLANKLKKSTVVFTGPIYGQEKLALYDLSTIFILPSVYASFGLVTLEAMARGKPIIVSNCCGVAEIVKEKFGIVVSYNNSSCRAKNLGKEIMKILQMDLTSMGAAAKKEVLKI